MAAAVRLERSSQRQRPRVDVDQGGGAGVRAVVDGCSTVAFDGDAEVVDGLVAGAGSFGDFEDPAQVDVTCTAGASGCCISRRILAGLPGGVVPPGL
ncbi:hypothetical protein [Streptomyces sp. NPDC004134]|uniref:hypothetical protein n=1 Tax=Streptomyces sp. NPDC004134 TaxID=3364691 RepID=UPI0036A685D2